MTTSADDARSQTTSAEERQSEEHRARYLRREVFQQCAQAVTNLERLATEARIEIERLQVGDSQSGPQMVGLVSAIHLKAIWGAAKASSALSSAAETAANLTAILAKLEATAKGK